MPPQTREQMVDAAALLFQREGYHATSWRRLVDASGAPWGSISHHFPGGKEELGVAAIERGGEAVSALIEHCFAQRRSAAQAVGDWFAFSARMLDETDYAAGCPVATVALETAGTSPALAAASREVFAGWQRALREGPGRPRPLPPAGHGARGHRPDVHGGRPGHPVCVEHGAAPMTAAGRLASRLVADAERAGRDRRMTGRGPSSCEVARRSLPCRARPRGHLEGCRSG